ncbi:MAG: glycosyltransferase family 2 protein [Planctomycetales bacterium]
MTAFAIGCVVLLLLLTAVRFASTLAYVRDARSFDAAPLPDGPAPRVAVLMPVRGADPHLARGIESVLEQDYPNFELRIVVDSVRDPAWEVASRVVGERQAEHVFIEELREKRPTCSLLCSALLQFFGRIESSSDIMAICASDSIVPRYWLREMVAALADPSVGATLGNRWYMPATARWGSLVRYMWNAASVVYMRMYRIPWGGAMALRVADVRRSGLLDRWRRAMVEDTSMPVALEALGLKLKHIPNLIVVNREETDLASCFRFITRQLFWVSLYYPAGGKPMFAVGMLIGLATIVPVVLAAVAALAGQFVAFWWLAGGFAAHVAVMLCSLLAIDRNMRQRIACRGEPTTPLTLPMLLKFPLALPLAQLVFFGATLAARFLRVVEWRGIRYRIRGPLDVEMLEYRPYVPSGGTVEANASVEG